MRLSSAPPLPPHGADDDEVDVDADGDGVARPPGRVTHDMSLGQGVVGLAEGVVSAAATEAMTSISV